MPPRSRRTGANPRLLSRLAARTRGWLEGGATWSAIISGLDLRAYEAPRAAPLAGVPVSTVYHWARTGASGHARPTAAVEPSGPCPMSNTPRA
jgi:hypothetical protein